MEFSVPLNIIDKAFPDHAMKVYGWSGGIATLTLNLGAGWK